MPDDPARAAQACLACLTDERARTAQTARGFVRAPSWDIAGHLAARTGAAIHVASARKVPTQIVRGAPFRGRSRMQSRSIRAGSEDFPLRVIRRWRGKLARAGLPPLFARRWHEQKRNGRQSQRSFGDAAEQPARHAASPVRSEDDELRLPSHRVALDCMRHIVEGAARLDERGFHGSLILLAIRGEFADCGLEGDLADL
ncbi:MAG: hypothetical protein V4793_39075 [Paraburkholderia tropica]